MADTITLTINTKIAQIGASIGIAAVSIGLPRWLAFRIVQALAWVRISHADQPSWHGWTWVGRNMRLTDG